MPLKIKALIRIDSGPEVIFAEKVSHNARLYNWIETDSHIPHRCSNHTGQLSLPTYSISQFPSLLIKS